MKLPAIASLFLVIAACPRSEAPPREAAHKATHALPSAAPGKGDKECFPAPDAAEPSQELTLGARHATLAGGRLAFAATPPRHRVALGLVSELRSASDGNLAAFRALAGKLVQAGASGIVVLGDSGDTADEIAAALGAFAGAGVPVYANPGAREDRDEWDAALATLQKRAPNVFDLRRVRVVDEDGVRLVSLPGHFDRRYVREGACQYLRAELDDVKRLAAGATEPVLLVSHGPPHQDAPGALDWTEDDHHGDAALAALLASAKIPFGAFGFIAEAGGRGTDLGGVFVPPGAVRDSLYVNPGPADVTPWPMNGGGTGGGQAALIVIDGGKARYELVHAP